jgi:hypothetical protein
MVGDLPENEAPVVACDCFYWEKRRFRRWGHERSAVIFERHAMLLDRFGAHRSAKTERRHAEDERDAAVAARRSPTRQPDRGHGEVCLHG